MDILGYNLFWKCQPETETVFALWKSKCVNVFRWKVVDVQRSASGYLNVQRCDYWGKELSNALEYDFAVTNVLVVTFAWMILFIIILISNITEQFYLYSNKRKGLIIKKNVRE